MGDVSWVLLILDYSLKLKHCYGAVEFNPLKGPVLDCSGYLQEKWNIQAQLSLKVESRVWMPLPSNFCLCWIQVINLFGFGTAPWRVTKAATAVLLKSLGVDFFYTWAADALRALGHDYFCNCPIVYSWHPRCLFNLIFYYSLKKSVTWCPNVRNGWYKQTRL